MYILSADARSHSSGERDARGRFIVAFGAHCWHNSPSPHPLRGASPMPSLELNRRSFLAATAASASGLMTTRTAPAADDFGGFNVGVQSYTFRNFDLEQMLKKTKELG